jgi:predicted nucleic acid-binding Zn ribbon protein
MHEVDLVQNRGVALESGDWQLLMYMLEDYRDLLHEKCGCGPYCRACLSNEYAEQISTATSIPVCSPESVHGKKTAAPPTTLSVLSDTYRNLWLAEQRRRHRLEAAFIIMFLAVALLACALLIMIASVPA